MSMLQKWLKDARLFLILQQYDADIAAKAQAKGCACGGRLHCGHYPRKPRGLLAEVGEAYERRFSFCCADCRRRTTPVSVRFLGRRVFVGATVLLISAMALGLTAKRVSALIKEFGVNRRTLRRWRRWWQEEFVTTAFWRGARASFAVPVDTARLPASLLEKFGQPDELMRVRCTLSFLAPLTTNPWHRGTGGRCKCGR